MNRAIGITILAFASLLPVVANSAERNINSSLRGDYAFSGEATCLSSSAANAFSNFHANNPNAAVVSYTVSGLLHFNGDGTGSTISGRAVGINHNVNRDANGNFLSLGTATVSLFNGDFDYTVAPDHTIHIVRKPLTTTQIVGPAANTPNATEIWKGIEFDGHVSQDFKTLMVATAASDPNNPGLVLEYGYSPGAPTGSPPNQTRACHRSRTLIKIGDGDGRSQGTWPFSGH